MIVRILFLHSGYRFVGGEERHIDILSCALDREGHRVEIYCRRSPSIPIPRRRRLELAAGMIYNRTVEREVLHVLSAQRRDVVHAHNILPMLSPSVLHAAKRAHVPVVMTLHNFRFVCPSGLLVRAGRLHEDCITGSSFLCALRGARDSRTESLAYGLAIEVHRRLRLIDRWVDVFLAPSKFLSRIARRSGLSRPIEVVPNGVDPAPEPSPSGNYGAFVGRLSREKGAEILVAAARLARGVPIQIAGDGPLRASLPAAPTVMQLGVLSHQRAAQLLSGARFVVVPSTCAENAPYAVLEAMACGKPIIASDVGGLPELIEHRVNGLLVPPGDPCALAEAMSELWEDREFAERLGCAGWQAARTRYSLGQQVEALGRIYARSAELARNRSATDSQE